MKNYLILFLTPFTLTTAIEQRANDHIITIDQNSIWISDFRKGSLETRIELLKQRILSDQQVYFTPSNPHGKTPIKEGFDTLTFVRPIYFFRTQDSEPLRLPPNLGEGLIEKLKLILNTENIASIELNDDKAYEALYGAMGTYGIITIVLKNEDHYFHLKKLVQQL